MIRGSADIFKIYCAHCKSIGQEPPSQEWWERAISRSRPAPRQSDIQFDVDTERRDGWSA